MRKANFDHVIAAAAQICGEDEIVVIGSQSIWGSLEEPPEAMVLSLEADVYPRRNPSRADEIEGALGDGSRFQAMNGYYAHGVGPETAKAPAGWEERLVPVEVPRRAGRDGFVLALCLEPHDLVLAKCVAGRERDWDFAGAALEHRVVDFDLLLSRVEQLPVAAEEQARVEKMLRGIQRKLG